MNNKTINILYDEYRALMVTFSVNFNEGGDIEEVTIDDTNMSNGHTTSLSVYDYENSVFDLISKYPHIYFNMGLIKVEDGMAAFLLTTEADREFTYGKLYRKIADRYKEEYNDNIIHEALDYIQSSLNYHLENNPVLTMQIDMSEFEIEEE